MSQYAKDIIDISDRLFRYAEPAATLVTGAAAEPLSGLYGLANLAITRNPDSAANAVNQAQRALTYQPRTAQGQAGLRGLQDILQPIGEVVQGASQNLGDKAYGATGSPALAAAAYSAPTAMLEALGLKGLSVAKSPVKAADLYSARMGMGAIDDGGIVRLYHGSPVDFDEFDPSRVGDRLTSLGLGHYLTPNKEMARQYGQNVMEFDVDTSNFLNWSNLKPADRARVEQELTKIVPPERVAHFGETKIKVLPRGKEGAAEFRKLQEQTKSAYNDYAKARILDDDDIEKINPELLSTLGPDDIVVGWREGGDMKNLNSQQLMTLMNEFAPDLAKGMGYKGSVFGDQVAVYDSKNPKRVK